MSTNKNRFIGVQDNFAEVWSRIIEETDIRTLTDLGKVVGKKQQSVSSSKKKNYFPPGWAYYVAQEYNLLTKWIVTGEGPKRLDECTSSTDLDFHILGDINEWLKEFVAIEPYRREWFRGTMEDAFPDFKDWQKRKEQKNTEVNNFPESKVA